LRKFFDVVQKQVSFRDEGRKQFLAFIVSYVIVK
jgi:hypothetical protein